MQLSRFRDLLHRHGPRFERWPAAEAAAARALLATSAEARAVLVRAERLDGALMEAAPTLEAERVRRMRRVLAARVARMPLPERPSALARLLRPLWPALPAGAGAVAVLAGCGLWLVLASPLDRWPAGGTDPLAATQVLALAEIGP